MKKIVKLLTISLVVVSAAASLEATSPAAKNFMEFKKWARDKKIEWLNWAGKLAKSKYELVAKQDKEWFDYGIKSTANLDAVTTVAEKDALIQKDLEEAIAIEQKHAQEMKAFWQEKMKEAQDMGMKDAQERHDLKVKFGLIPAEKEEADVVTAPAAKSWGEKIKAKIKSL